MGDEGGTRRMKGKVEKLTIILMHSGEGRDYMKITSGDKLSINLEFRAKTIEVKDQRPPYIKRATE